jgi:hypothetical protein
LSLKSSDYHGKTVSPDALFIASRRRLENRDGFVSGCHVRASGFAANELDKIRIKDLIIFRVSS